MEENPYKAPADGASEQSHRGDTKKPTPRIFLLAFFAIVGGFIGFLISLPLVGGAAMTLMGVYEWDERVRLLQTCLFLGCPVIGVLAAWMLMAIFRLRVKPPA